MKAELSEPHFTNQLSLVQQEELACVLDEYLIGMEQGAAPNLTAICDEHQELAPAIRHYVKSLMFLNRAAGKEDSQSNQIPKRKDAPNKEIGDFRIIREVGRGGMGVVYEAMQISLGRRVALKLLPFAAVLDQRQIARFQNEAQAAAQLHHPHIVPVYSIGNDRGTYYYSMQFIDGQSLEKIINGMQIGCDSWSIECQQSDAAEDAMKFSCDPDGTTMDGDLMLLSDSDLDTSRARPIASIDQRNKSVNASESTANKTTKAMSTQASIRTRSHIKRIAELGIQAADAIHFAHQHGIVHRDIKPSNLLIDRSGKLWVADFGLAQCGDMGGLTQSGDVIGTLRYMSPEQAAGRTHWIDNRTDIYSLGLTLYELLTLSSAVTGHDRLVMLRQIESEQPVAPRRLNPSIPVDLENVILKAISKEREDRYSTAGEFAEDLQRWLDGKTTLARRPSLIDRSSRWVAKNAKLVAVAVLVLLVLLSVSAINASMFRAKNRAIEAANRLATKHLDVANKVVDRFGAQLMAKLEWLPGTEELQHEVAQNSIDYLNAFAEYASHDPTQRVAVCNALLKLAKLQELQGAEMEAISTYRRAKETLPVSPAQNDETAEPSDEYFLCQNNLACLLMRVGRSDEAVELFSECIKVFGRVAIKSPSQARNQSLRQSLLHLNLGHLYRERGERHAAAAELETAWIEIGKISLEDAERSASQSTDLYPMLIAALLQVASNEDTDRKSGYQLLNVALELANEHAKTNPDQLSAHHDICVSQLSLGAWMAKGKAYQAAKSWFEKAASGFHRLCLRCPSNVRLQSDHASALNNLGQTELDSGNANAALEAFESSRKILTTLANTTSDYTVHSNLGGVLNNLALAQESLGHSGTARSHLMEAIEHQKLAIKTAPDCQRCQAFLSEHESHLLRVSGNLPTSHDAKLPSNY